MGVERSIVRRIALLWIALCLGSPLGAGAETAAADDDAGSGAETAAPADAGKAAGEPAKPAPVGKKEALAELSDLPPPDPDAKVEAYPGIIHQVVNNAIVVRRAGRTSDPTAPAFMAFTGKLGVPVEGQGKNSWLALRKGDVVMVSYVKGPPHQTTEVAVLADGKAKAKAVARIPEVVSHQPRQRSFIGYVKKKEGDELIVMSPKSPPPGRRPAEVKAFVRTEETQVAVLRDSWESLRKGDRVRIGHQKGNPRPIDVVQVIRVGGEEPLPPGVATRLFHPDYDESVKDVDGIGETGPVPRPPTRKPGGGIQVKRR